MEVENLVKKLEIIVSPKSRKRLEFKQSLDYLSGTLQNYCSKLEIIEAEDGVTFTLLFQWETSDQMRQAIRGEECSILSGAITALCEKTVIRLDDIEVGNHISMLTTL